MKIDTLYGEVKIKIKVAMSLWSAIKLRIAGMKNTEKEIIDIVNEGIKDDKIRISK